MALLRNFVRTSDELVQFESVFAELNAPDHTIHTLEVHKDELKEMWSSVKDAYAARLNELLIQADAISVEAVQADLDSTKTRYRTCYATYVRCVAKIGEIHQLRFTPVSASTFETSGSRDTNSAGAGNETDSPLTHFNIRLPPCDTDIFSGDYLAWPSFRDMFTAIYVNNNCLSPVEKLFHLSQKTEGEARQIVKAAPLTHAGFLIAWTNLVDRYDNTRLLVNSQLKIMFNLKSILEESASAIQILQREINSCRSSLQLYDIPVESWDPIFVYLCCSRLPDQTLALWEQSLTDKTLLPPWSELDVFLTGRYQTLETVADHRGGQYKTRSSFANPSGSLQRHRTQYNVHMAQVNTASCKLCDSAAHSLRKCIQFMEKSPMDRNDLVKKLKLCFNCLASSHVLKDCRSPYNCASCNKRHHTLLHNNSTESDIPGPSPKAPDSAQRRASVPPSADNLQVPPTIDPSSSTIKTCFLSQSRKVLLGTAIVNIIHDGVVYPARALIDPGSEGSFLTDRLCNLLKLPCRPTSAQISGINNAVSARVQKVTSLTISSPLNSKAIVKATAFVVPQLTGNLPSHSINVTKLQNLPLVPLADSQFYASSQVDLLLGGELFPVIMRAGVLHSVCDSLLAQETIFGWILTGPLNEVPPASNTTLSAFFNEVLLDDQIARFWEVEDLPQKRIMTEEDRFCEEHYRRTTRRNSDGRYIVSLPFKQNYPLSIQLGDSRAIALARYKKQEVRLGKIPLFQKDYDTVIREYFHLGHMKRVDPPASNLPRNYFYLPHHAIVRPESSSTKIRVVFNASSSSSNGTSLNDILCVGPALQADLSILILKWRFFQFVFNSDIEKMYRQILVDPKHTPFQRIMFRNSATSDIQDFELQTVTFGVNCAPYLAIRTLLQLASDVESTHPLAAQHLQSSMYVDDVLAGAHDLSTALRARDQLIEVLASAGFLLRKWTSNHKELFKGIPKEHLLREDFLDFADSSTSKALGIKWNAREDYFSFSPAELVPKSRIHKREVFSHLAKLFDPIGWLAPCIILSKILMQQIWIDRTGWDEAISERCQQNWQFLVDTLPFIRDIRIPRWIDFSEGCKIEFHGFCDASEKAYAAALYVRIGNAPNVTTHLLSAKTRVAPVKSLSLPRLELCGAVLLSDVIESLWPYLEQHAHSITCWTDSTIVLAWMSKAPCHWSAFVANRVSKITRSAVKTRWFHVPSTSNPADLASRGVTPQALVNNPLWWDGPTWLKESPSLWPLQNVALDCGTIPEQKPVKVFAVRCQDLGSILERFSSYPRMIRVLAYIFRFFDRVQKRDCCHQSRGITAIEVIKVRNRLIALIQSIAYPVECDRLSNKEILPSTSSLLNLNPFLDSWKLMRVSGRLVFSPEMSFNERHPIILPYTSHFTRLLVQFTHIVSLHGGNQLVLRLLRTEFWIPRAKNLIKTTIHNCKTCVLFKQRVRTQLMSALPKERTEFSRAFTITGLDFAGPFDLKSFTGRACLVTKGYVCIFVCFSTKAIHLEATSSLTTAAFLAAFNRFVSRRGFPSQVYSDNGTTFVGASKALSRELLLATREAVHVAYAPKGLTWHFIPPGAPHMGGLWEAGVKSFKAHFKKVAAGAKYTFEEFSTLLSKIESCLNSRPLAPMSDNPTDLAALTPGHFLIGCPLLAPAETTITDPAASVLNRWQKLKAIHQQFCRRWKQEYLCELHKRTKWKQQQDSLQENSLVAIKDDNAPPNEWRLGRVVTVYPGRDGRVRIADLHTQRGLVQRPIVKLVVIPTENSSFPTPV